MSRKIKASIKAWSIEINFLINIFKDWLKVLV